MRPPRARPGRSGDPPEIDGPTPGKVRGLLHEKGRGVAKEIQTDRQEKMGVGKHERRRAIETVVARPIHKRSWQMDS